MFRFSLIEETEAHQIPQTSNMGMEGGKKHGNIKWVKRWLKKELWWNGMLKVLYKIEILYMEIEMFIQKGLN